MTDWLIKTATAAPAPAPAITPAYCASQLQLVPVYVTRCYRNLVDTPDGWVWEGQFCQSYYSHTYELVTTCYPAVVAATATPPNPAATANLGWNSGARSIASFSNDGDARFSVPTYVAGVVCGLDDAFADYNETSIPFAFYCQHGQAQVIEYGVPVYTVGAYAATDVFKISRVNGQVRYAVNGQTVYTSTRSNFNPLFLRAALYAAGDAVTSPVIEALAGSHGGANLSTPDWALIGADYAYAQAQLALPFWSLTTHAASAAPHLAPTPNLPLVMQMTLGAHGLTGGSGSASLSMPDWALVQHGRAALSMTLALSAVQIDPPDAGPIKYATAFTGWAGQDQYAAPQVMAVSFTDLMRLADSYALTGFVDADLLAAFQLHGSLTAQLDVNASALSHALFIAGIDIDGTVYDGWVMNLNTEAYSRYEGWQFNSFAKVAGQYMAAAADGLYVLDGDDDHGDPINASILLGKTDYRSPYKKRLPNAYFGIAGDGQMVLRIFHDADTPQTFVFSPKATLSGSRVKLAHGLESRYWQLQLANRDGADFTLDSIELLPVTLSRRI